MTLKPREKIMIVLAALVGLVMGFDQFVAYPKKKELAVLQKQVREANEKLASLSVSLTGLTAMKKRVEEKRKWIEVSSGKVADTRQLDLFLNQLGNESRTRPIELIQMNISEQAKASSDKKEGDKTEGFKKVVMDVGLLASFEAIGPFLETFQSLPIFLEVERVDISRKEGAFPKLEVFVQQNLYISKSEPGNEPGKFNVNKSQPSS